MARLPTTHVERLQFDKTHLRLKHYIPKHILEDGWELERYEDYVIRGLAYTLNNFIAHGKREVKKYQLVPATWRDHLKLTINEWAAKEKRFFFSNISEAIKTLKLKVNYKRIAVNIVVQNYCPHFKSPDNVKHIEFMQVKSLMSDDIREWMKD